MLMIYPNPFKNRTDIRLEIPDISDKMHLEIYDVSGRLVKQFLLPTPYSLVPTAVSWDGKDELGLELPQGVYVVRLECQDVILTDKTILLR
jgi:flagellar hook assembly protein FlgD